MVIIVEKIREPCCKTEMPC